MNFRLNICRFIQSSGSVKKWLCFLTAAVNHRHCSVKTWKRLIISALISFKRFRQGGTPPFFMLKRINEIIVVIHGVKPKIKQSPSFPSLSADELLALPEIVQKLEPFETATRYLSASSRDNSNYQRYTAKYRRSWSS